MSLDPLIPVWEELADAESDLHNALVLRRAANEQVERARDALRIAQTRMRLAVEGAMIERRVEIAAEATLRETPVAGCA